MSTAHDTTVPSYTAGAQPQYEYDPQKGYITPGQFDDAPSSDEDGDPTTETSDKQKAAENITSKPATESSPHAEEGDDDDLDYDYDEEDEELFDEALEGEDWSGATGDFTKSLNRQRRLAEVASQPSSSVQAPRINPQKPKANMQARVDDQISSLSKFATRIKLSAAESGLSGKSDKCVPGGCQLRLTGC